MDARPLPRAERPVPEWKVALAENVQIQWGEWGAYRPKGEDTQAMWVRRTA